MIYACGICLATFWKRKLDNQACFVLAWNSSISDSRHRNLARTPPFPIPSVLTWLELLHSRFQASELGSNSTISDYKASKLGLNSSIPDSKLRNLSRTLQFPIPGIVTCFELLHFRFQASEIGSNSSIPGSKHRKLTRTLPFPIPSLELGSNSSIPDSKPRT